MLPLNEKEQIEKWEKWVAKEEARMLKNKLAANHYDKLKLLINFCHKEQIAILPQVDDWNVLHRNYTSKVLSNKTTGASYITFDSHDLYIQKFKGIEIPNDDYLVDENLTNKTQFKAEYKIGDKVKIVVGDKIKTGRIAKVKETAVKQSYQVAIEGNEGQVNMCWRNQYQIESAV